MSELYIYANDDPLEPSKVEKFDAETIETKTFGEHSVQAPKDVNMRNVPNKVLPSGNHFLDDNMSTG